MALSHFHQRIGLPPFQGSGTLQRLTSRGGFPNMMANPALHPSVIDDWLDLTFRESE
jgi:hypothetical protein